MCVQKSGARILWYECFGFGFILLLSWANQLLDLPHLLVGGDLHASRWRDTAMETMLILLIWAFVHSLTSRLVARLHYLEGMLRVCAWCRKVGQADRWVRLEDYFSEGFQIGTTHGVCPDCLKRLEEDTNRFYRAQPQPLDPNLPGTEPAPGGAGVVA